MRIGLFTNNYLPLQNGLATSVATFADAFRAAGHQVTIVAPRYANEQAAGGSGQRAGNERPAERDERRHRRAANPADCGPPTAYPQPKVIRVPGVRAPTHHAFLLPIAAWPGVRAAVEAQGLEIYHAQHPFLLGPAALRWARRARRPFVFTYHTRYDRYAHYLPGPAGLMARLARWRALRFAAQADVVVAPAPSLAHELRMLGLRRPIEVIPTGVPAPANPCPSRDETRSRLGLHGAPLCISAGRLAPEKNQDFLLRAFRHIVDAIPEARLVLVGEGDDRDRLLRIVGELGLGAAVGLTGGVAHERVCEYLAAADLFLFPSTSETQGLAALEALAMGLPVVAVNSPAALDLFGEEQPGRISPEVPQAFADAVRSVWEDPNRSALVESARRVARSYSAEVCAGRLLALYTDLLRVYGASFHRLAEAQS